jgi:hypothetical protein
MLAKQPEFVAWLADVKGTSREKLGRWDEKDLFAEYAEDYNTATLPHEKFYNLARWEFTEAAAGRAVAAASSGHASDADALRAEQQARRQRETQDREQQRLALLRDQLRQAKEANAAEYHDIADRRAAHALEAPTFESIAKQRAEEKRAKEMEARRKFR